MKIQTQLVILLLLIFSVIFPCSWAVEEAEYNSSTQTLTLPQVKVDNQYIYDARLQLNNDGLFALLGYSNSPSSSVNRSFALDSVAISNGELLDSYKCEKKDNNIENSIPLSWSNIPDGTNSLAIIMYHFPNPDDISRPNSYLLLWDIAPTVMAIPYGEADDGPWYMGANKDGTAISYTSPCSPSSGTHEYTITIYALSKTPPSLPKASSIDVTYNRLKAAIESVTVIDSASLTFNDVTP